LLAFKIEANLTKDQILELYLNQIFLGQRAYGFQSAANVYFGKNLADVTPAQAAMLAGLPQAPLPPNPVREPETCPGAPAVRPAADARGGLALGRELQEGGGRAAAPESQPARHLR